MSEPGRPDRRLSMLDCASIVVGIIIGSGIYRSTPSVAAQMSAAWQVAGVWVAGGLFALVGSLCYAELATRYPDHGGDYVYLREAYGPRVGFLFAWTQLWIIRPGSIGAMACIFAEYAEQLWPLGPRLGLSGASFLIYSGGSILLLTIVNMLGVRFGTRTQNLLTGAKVVGLTALIVTGYLTEPAPTVGPSLIPAKDADLVLAMIMVLFAYSGWNEVGCVAAEVREPRRNILRALLLGTVLVTAVYLGVNGACLHVLGLGGMAQSEAVAADAVRPIAGASGARAISLLICVSALGSLNGMIFTGARIYYAMGLRHRMFSLLARWHSAAGSPLWSLGIQGAITLGLVCGFGLSGGAGGEKAAFERLVIFMTPPFYLFLIATASAVVVFRRRYPMRDSGVFHMPLYPLPPLIVAAASAFMLYGGVNWIVFNVRSQGAALGWAAAWVVATFATGAALSGSGAPAVEKADG